MDLEIKIDVENSRVLESKPDLIEFDSTFLPHKKGHN